MPCIIRLFCAAMQEKRMSDLVKAKVTVQKGGQTLRIRNVDSDDEGRYFCRVSNSVGMQESYVDLTMLGQCQLSPSLSLVSFSPFVSL